MKRGACAVALAFAATVAEGAEAEPFRLDVDIASGYSGTRDGLTFGLRALIAKAGWGFGAEAVRSAGTEPSTDEASRDRRGSTLLLGTVGASWLTGPISLEAYGVTGVAGLRELTCMSTLCVAGESAAFALGGSVRVLTSGPIGVGMDLRATYVSASSSPGIASGLLFLRLTSDHF